MKIEKQTYSGVDYVNARHSSGLVNGSEKVTDHLLFAILEKLEEVRCGLVDVEDAVNDNNPGYALRKHIK